MKLSVESCIAEYFVTMEIWSEIPVTWFLKNIEGDKVGKVHLVEDGGWR